MAVRLLEVGTGRRFIVHEQRVFAGVDRIGVGDEVEADPRVLAAARALGDQERVPGLEVGEGFRSAGRLNAVEMGQFLAGGTAAARTLLEEHLAFFDRRELGVIAWADNYAAWRALGFGVPKSLFQTLGSTLLFGQGGVIHIDRIGTRRPQGATGLYDARGNLDAERWRAFQEKWRAASGPEERLTRDESRRLVGRLGRIPARQFESLYAVCARMNGSDSVTLEQVGWLYDGSLLWRAAAVLSVAGILGGRESARKRPS